MTADPRDQWGAHHFSQTNGAGDDWDDVPALLRRVAKTIEDLGEVDVLDITFHGQSSTGDDFVNEMTVYYARDADEP